MKFTLKELKEIVCEVVSEQLQQVGPAWGSGDPGSGLGGFAGKVGTSGIKTAKEKAKKAKAEEERLALAATQAAAQDKTAPGGKTSAAERQRIKQAQQTQQMFMQARGALDKLSTDPAKLKALLQFLQGQQTS